VSYVTVCAEYNEQLSSKIREKNSLLQTQLERIHEELLTNKVELHAFYDQVYIGLYHMRP